MTVFKELDAMRAIAQVVEPLEPRFRARVLLSAALSFDPIPISYEQQLHLLRVANTPPAKSKSKRKQLERRGRNALAKAISASGAEAKTTKI